MRVLLVQAAPEPGDRRANAAAVAAALGVHPDADLAVFPELFLDGYDPASARATASSAQEAAALVGAAAAQHGTAVVVGFVEAHQDGRCSNSVAVVSSAGELAAVYRKTHLFGDVEPGVFTPGQEYVVTTVAGCRVAPLICFDVEFPEPARTVAHEGAELLVTVAANMAPYAEHHRLAARARALENRCPHVYVNRVGREAGHAFVGGSCVVDHDGRVLAAADPGTTSAPGEPALLLVDVAVGERPGDDFDYLHHVRDRLPVRTIQPQTAGGPA